jgi:FkbM family methyltransferase
MTFISYAQNYEDIMLYRALRDVGEGFYVDVGANSPDEHSVTRAFYERGWRGINIEPVMEFHQQLLAARPRDINLPVAISDKTGFIDFHDVKGTGLSTISPKIAENHRASGYEVVRRSVAVETLDEVFRKYVSGDVHFLKIDVEGLEDAVLRGVSLVDVRPWIIVVEATAVLSEVQTHASWDHLLTDRGYSFVYFDGLNRFYVAKEHPELAPSFQSAPNVFDDWMRVGDRQAHDKANILSAKLLEVEEAHRAELEARKDELDAARAEVEEWKAKAAALQISEEEQRAREAALEARLSDLKAQLSSFEGQTLDLMGTMGEAAELRAAIAVMRNEFRDWVAIRERTAEREAHFAEREAQLGAQVAAATAEATALRHRIAELEYAASVTKLNLDSMFASTSWRVTAPVRAVKTAVISSARAIGAVKVGVKQPEESLIRRAAHWSARQPMLKRAAVAVLVRSPALERKVRAIVAPPPGVQPAAVAHIPQPRQIENTGPAITSRNPTPAEIIAETAFQRALARAR